MAQFLRHPEKEHLPDKISPPKPHWLRVKAPGVGIFQKTASIIGDHRVHTVCEEASCPNIGSCWSENHAAFMIMGNVCTRACAFCNVTTGKPNDLDMNEPERLAKTIAQMKLSFVVITSVDRDDLPDGGAEYFTKVIRAIRDHNPSINVEILTPDFKHKPRAVETIATYPPDVFNHNLETVSRLYASICPGASYFTSLQLLYQAKQQMPTIFTKSGLMVGLGEQDEEILQAMDDLRAADVDFLTIGQYLQPTKKHVAVVKYITPDQFKYYEKMAYYKGFLMVASSPITRSSFHADKDFHILKQKRLKLLQS